MKSNLRLYFLITVFLCLASNLRAEGGLLEKGIEEYRNENFEEALSLLLSAREQEPDSPVIAFYLGLTYKQTGGYNEAVKYFKNAISLIPPVKDAYVELIDTLYNLNELKEAYAWAEKAEKAGIKPGQVAFLKGLILLKKNSNREAVASFKKAKEIDPSLSQPSEFQVALIYAKEMRLKEAIESMKAVIAIAPQSEIASFASEYEKVLLRNLKSYMPVKLTAGAAYQYDDNVVLKPSAAIPGVEITGEKDNAAIAAFTITYNPLPAGPFFFGGQGSVSSNTYFKNSTHNLLNGAVIFSPGYSFSNGAFALPVSYSYAWLKEKPYMSAISARPALNVMFPGGHIGQFTAGYSKRNMLQPFTDANEDRNGRIYSASAGYIYPFAGGRGMVNLRYEFSLDNTDGSNWANKGNRFSAGVLLPLVEDKLNLTVTGDAFIQDYKNIHTIFQERRRDRTYSGIITLTYAVLKGLSLNAQYNYNKAVSNIEIYGYNRNVYTAGVEYTF